MRCSSVPRFGGAYRVDSAPIGHVFRVVRKRGPVWYAKYRLPDGRQVQKMLGPAWTERGRPPAGFITKRQAEQWLADTLHAARVGTLPGLVRTGVTFADASREWLGYVEQERGRKASTIADYRSAVRAHLDPAFGELALEDVTGELIERSSRASLRAANCPGVACRSCSSCSTASSGAPGAYGSCRRPGRRVDRLPIARRAAIDFYSPEEVHALVRAAADEQDGALCLTAALTGLRMGELLALRWRDVDFAAQTIRVAASCTAGTLGTPKSGLGRAVPLVDEVAQALARLALRERFTGPDELVFAGVTGGHLDARRSVVATRSRATPLGCGRCAFTTCVTRSAALRSVPPTRARSKSRWVTPTSRPRRSTCTTSRARIRREDCGRRLAAASRLEA